MILELAAIIAFQALIFLKLRRLTMIDLPTLLAGIADLKTSTDALLARPSNPAPVDLQPALDAVTAIKAEVDNVLTAPAG